MKWKLKSMRQQNPQWVQFTPYPNPSWVLSEHLLMSTWTSVLFNLQIHPLECLSCSSRKRTVPSGFVLTLENSTPLQEKTSTHCHLFGFTGCSEQSQNFHKNWFETCLPSSLDCCRWWMENSLSDLIQVLWRACYAFWTCQFSRRFSKIS